MRRHSKRQARIIKEQGRITDKYRLHAWWLGGILDAAEATRRPPLHPDLYEEYDNGGWCVSAGYVRITDPQALRRLIAETERGLPYRRSRFAQDHPDLFALCDHCHPAPQRL